MTNRTESNDIETWLNHNNFYVIHGTESFDSLINILKSGKLNRGIDTAPKFTKLGKCGGEGKGIYVNIYFDDVKNIENLGIFSFALLFHPRVMFRSEVEFWLGWGYCGMKPIKMYPDDNIKKMKNNIKKIKKIVTDIKNDPIDFLPSIYHGAPGNFLHEIYLDTKYIPLTNNLLGILCNQYNEKYINEIKEIISIHPYKNVYIQNNLLSMPDFKEINK